MANAPTDPSPRFALAYPIAFFGLALFLCAWGLNGNRIFAPIAWVEQEIAPSESP